MNGAAMNGAATDVGGARQRIDKLLWHLRLAGSRSGARAWVEAGHIRVNGRRIDRPATPIAAGDVLTLPMRHEVRLLAITTLPARRGPASEAQACYQVLDPSAIASQSAPQQHPQKHPGPKDLLP